MEKTRLPTACLGHDRDKLAMSLHCQIERVLHLVYFALSSDELRQAPPWRKLKARPQRTMSGDFVNIDRLADAFDLLLPQSTEFEVALNQLSGVFAYGYGTSRCHRLQARSKIRRMSD